MVEEETTVEADGEGPARRGRGRPPQISRERIVAAARSMPREELTMQAVADVLGVSRKALHYHVGDKKDLLNLVVVDLFESKLASVDLPAADWRTVLRAFAHASRDGVLEIGIAAIDVQLRGMGGLPAMKLAERVVQSLFEAGFDETLARRAITVVSNLAMMAGHIALLEAQNGIYPQEAELTAALMDMPPEQVPGLRRILAVVQNETPDEEFEFELDLVITGLGQRCGPGSPRLSGR